jgi:hypothetical protein
MKSSAKFMMILMAAYGAGVAAIPVAVLVFFLTGIIPIDAVSAPPGWEAGIGQAALKASLAGKSAGLVDPVGDNSAALMAGMNFYRNNCTGCHGDQAKASKWGTHGLYPRAPQFAQQAPALTAPEMFLAVKYGIRYTAMFAHVQASDQEIWQTVTFLSRLDSLPPAVDSGWRSSP